MEKREQAKKRVELARLLVEAALSRCQDIGVSVHVVDHRNRFGQEILPTVLKYHHPEMD